MYISQVVLTSTDSYEQHQAIWGLFPNTPERKRDHLFRVESQNKGQIVAILQSSTEPKSSDNAQASHDPQDTKTGHPSRPFC